jgi:spermidine/putrescine-binding protein
MCKLVLKSKSNFIKMKQVFPQILFFVAISFIISCSNAPSSKNESTQASGDLKRQGKTLKLLCWEGYASEKFSDAFEAQTGIQVNITTFNSAEKLSEKLTTTGKGTFDVVTVSSDMAQALVERNLVQPIDLNHITHYDSLSDILRAMQDVVKNGATYGVPFTWGPDYLVYDADVIKKEPTSWNELFDPKYKGHVSIWDDAYNISLMGILNGDADENKQQIYNMNDLQLEAAKKKLMALNPSIYKYWTSPKELTDLMRSKKVVIAVGLQFLLAKLRKEGLNIKGVIPSEGATGWIDRLMIPKNAPNKELAEMWIDYITKAENMAVVSQVTGYCVSNSNAARYLSPEQLEITQMDKAQDIFIKLNFWQYVRNRKKYNAIWDEVKGSAK